MFACQFAQMNHIARLNGWTQFVNMQCQYSLLYHEEKREMPPYCFATLYKFRQDRPNGMCASGGPGAVLVWP